MCQENQITRIRCVVSLAKFACSGFRLNRLLISAYAAGSAAPPTRRKKMRYFKCPPNTLTHTDTQTYICRQAHALAFGGWFNAQHRQILTFALMEHAPLTDACHLGHTTARGAKEAAVAEGEGTVKRSRASSLTPLANPHA